MTKSVGIHPSIHGGLLPQEATVTFLPFQILYFEDLSVGMVEAHSKTVKSSDVVGFAEIT